MIEKMLWSFVIVAISYITAIFVFPGQTDEIASILGIESFNVRLREIKSSVSEDRVLPKSIQDMNSGSGFLDNTQELIGKARDSVENLKSSIGSGRVILDVKVEQAKKISDSAQKTADSLSELKKDILTGITDGAQTSSGK